MLIDVTVWCRLSVNRRRRRRLLLLLHCRRCLSDARWQHVWQCGIAVRIREHIAGIIRWHVVERQDTAVTEICNSVTVNDITPQDDTVIICCHYIQITDTASTDTRYRITVKCTQYYYYYRDHLLMPGKPQKTGKRPLIWFCVCGIIICWKADTLVTIIIIHIKTNRLYFWKYVLLIQNI